MSDTNNIPKIEGYIYNLEGEDIVEIVSDFEIGDLYNLNKAKAKAQEMIKDLRKDNDPHAFGSFYKVTVTIEKVDIKAKGVNED